MTNATWKKHPGSNNFDAAGNWSPAAVPNGTAFFGPSNTTSLTFSETTTIGGWTFKDTASNYSFDIPLLGLPFDGVNVTFIGAGIVVNGGSVSITNRNFLIFHNASTAGVAHIANNGNVSFYDTSTAGSAKFTTDNIVQFFDSSTAGRAHFTNNATVEFYNDSRAGKSGIINNAGAGLHFSNSSTAGAASINNVGGGDVDFYNTSNAGAARISNAGDIRFHSTSSAANAIFTNVASGLVQFSDTSGAGTARISADIVDFLDDSFAFHAHIAAHHLTFFDTTNAGAATITTVSGALTEFRDNSDGSDARFITKAGGSVDFALSSGPGGLDIISAGSIEGAGDYTLGANRLRVGFNNRSTVVSGAILSTPAVLQKMGTGTLTLSHAGNTYSGGTVLTQGTLDIAAQGAAGSGAIYFDVGSQRLKIENTALANHAFSNVVGSFTAGDVIDLAGLRFVTHAKATLNGATLTVKSGHVTDTLTLISPGNGTFKAKDDGHGGTKVVLVLPAAKPVAQAAAEKQGTEHHSDAHHALTAADNFEFTYLAGFTGLDRSWKSGFHLGPDQHDAPLNARGDVADGWSEPTHIDPGHHAYMLAGHDFFL